MHKDASSLKSFIASRAAFWLVGLVFLVCPHIHAQQLPNSSGKAIPPEGPLIQKRAPDFASWNITHGLTKMLRELSQASNGPSKLSPQEHAQKTTFVKTGDVIHMELTDDEHHAWNVWVKGDLQVVEWPDHKNLGLVAKPTNSSQSNPLFVDFSKSDFQGLEWISADNYVGTGSMDGKPCLIFKDSIKASSDPALGNGLSDESVAYVDRDTRLPIALLNRYGVSFYEFLPAPTAMLTMPQGVQAFVDKEQQTRLMLTRRPVVRY